MSKDMGRIPRYHPNYIYYIYVTQKFNAFVRNFLLVLSEIKLLDDLRCIRTYNLSPHNYISLNPACNYCSNHCLYCFNSVLWYMNFSIKSRINWNIYETINITSWKNNKLLLFFLIAVNNICKLKKIIRKEVEKWNTRDIHTGTIQLKT